MTRNMLTSLMCRAASLAVMVLLVLPGSASAATWINDGAVGPNELEVTLAVTCPAVSFVCDQVDGYSDVQTSTLTGGATLVIDHDLQQITFDSDSMQDVGSGLQLAYLTMDGTDLTFAGIPFAGVPEVINLLVFATTSPAIDVPGLDLNAPGDYPFSATLDYASLSEITGDLEFILPDLVLTPSAVSITGTFRVLGDVDMDMLVEYEIIDFTGTLMLQTSGTIGGEPVTIDVTGALTGNLSGEGVAPEVEIEVPSMGPAGLALLCGALALVGWRQRGAQA